MTNQNLLRSYGAGAKQKLREVYAELFSIRNYNFGSNHNLKDVPKVIVFSTASHPNLGDLAIAEAQKEFLIDNFKDYLYIEVADVDVYKLFNSLKRIISDKDLLFFHGGGNIGTLYATEERKRRFFVNKFKENKFISFPQSTFFSNNSFGKRELKLSENAYKTNKQFILTARESNTFNYMKSNFVCQTLLTPDIVLYLDRRVVGTPREGVMTAFRSDQEKSKSKEFEIGLDILLKKHFIAINKSDTTTSSNKPIRESERNSYIERILNEFRSAELVITDRLHGMIFSYITGTPCIAINNSNRKVEHVFKTWMKGINYIFFIKDADNRKEDIEEIIINIKGNFTPHYVQFHEEFNSLLELNKENNGKN